jgi:hypothetical protein
MNTNTRSMLLALLRHGLTTAGGALTTQGLASSDEVNQLAGAVITIVGIVWSIFEKRARNKAAQPASAPDTSHFDGP